MNVALPGSFSVHKHCDVKCDVFFFVAAGIDTSRYTLFWTILYLVAFPDIQEKAFEEIEKAVGKTWSTLLSYKQR